ncbi:DUF4091 domain-containing protein [Aestuariibaculum sediminum]|uniref:DUF4091 domain-containing protein n=1 Tax=Aestuariibaculum sediminum TaxID=2770637 RepID=A0A8J6Q732_9FLAO|nr:DUF4091 domain-containing protein [Aestuariibaculum sediminum]MBD0832323.1 DUF4091 domain-containing protein [Aestuariibaculum sediminum]
MNTTKLLLILTTIITLTSCKEEKEILISETYAEAVDPKPKPQGPWETTTSGLHASLVSPYIRFQRNSCPTPELENNWTGKAWRGERISAQMVFWSTDSITPVTTEFSDFISEDGNVIPASVAKLRFEKYVITDEFAGGCGYRKPKDFDSLLVADALENVSSYKIKAKETRPLWISIDVPKNAKPGNYKSTLRIATEHQDAKSFTFNLKILPATLPAPTDWKFHLDLWQNPYAVARYHHVEPWSEAHWNLLKPLMKMLAKAGQKVITTSINKRPWGGQTFDAFDSMIVWKKGADGTWTYDYSIFDQWVQFMMDLGVNKQISCYSMVPWGNEFYYFDETENKEVKIAVKPGSDDYAALWVPFLKDFAAHLKQKGWADITRIAMDERAPEEMQALLQLLKENEANFGVSLADNHKSYKLYPNQLKDLSVACGATIDPEDLKYRKEQGYVSTYYVCCSDKFPNIFTFSPPAEGVYLGWYATAAGFDGVLRWAYNSWVENPLIDSRFRAWPAGDTYVVYPGARSSVRFETLRDGIEDAEKIRVLRETLSQQHSDKALKELNDLVETFNTVEAPNDLNSKILNGQSILNRLAEKHITN